MNENEWMNEWIGMTEWNWIMNEWKLLNEPECDSMKMNDEWKWRNEHGLKWISKWMNEFNNASLKFHVIYSYFLPSLSFFEMGYSLKEN